MDENERSARESLKNIDGALKMVELGLQLGDFVMLAGDDASKAEAYDGILDLLHVAYDIAKFQADLIQEATK